ncbi:MAG: hypothetical protein HZB42_12680 [Sphingobacteriales bacterium]|nr:hypothetical protein [Sphingobacteriales bacterium]
MFKKKLSESDYFLIAANLLPVVGVFAWDWSPKEVFLVYCLETILLGIFTLVKIRIVTAVRKKDTWYSNGGSSKQSGLFFMFFFLMHYGIFVGVQMGIFFGVSGIGKGTNITAFNFFFKWPELISNDSLIMLGVFVFCYLFKMLYDFVFSGQYRTISMMRLMFQPYGRVFIQQITVILGSMFLSFGAGKIFILIFAFVKIFFEVFIDYDTILNRTMKDIKEDASSGI